MNYFFACVFTILMPVWSYYFYKTYQLCGYNLKSLFDFLFTKGLPFGNKNKLVFTKRMIRAIICHMFLCAILIFLSFVYLSNAGLIFLNLVVIFLFAPVSLSIAHLIMWPCEHLVKRY